MATSSPSPRLWFPMPRVMWVLLGVFALLALAYSLVFPPFEPVDEISHFDYVRYLIERRSFPVAQPGGLNEYHQPPLYYALVAAVDWPFSASDLAEYSSRPNPYSLFRYWEPSLDNKNRFVHGPWDLWPFPSSTSRAVHVGRLVSLLLGLGTVSLTYQMARWLVPARLAVGAAGLVAFLPMFLAVSGSLQNDAGAAFAGAVVLWLAVRYYVIGLNARRALLLGAAVGLGALMKVTVLFLLAPVVLAVFTIGLASFRDLVNPQRLRPRLIHLALLLLGVAVTGGGWYLRNQILYGDPTAAGLSIQVNRTWQQALSVLGDSLKFAWSTFWGRFGHTEVGLPQEIYDTLGFITVLAAAGLGLKLARFVRSSRATPVSPASSAGSRLQALWPYFFLGSAGLVEFAGLVVYMAVNPSGYMGRYTFPALPAYMLFFLLGLLQLAPGSARRYMARALPAFMLAFGAILLPAYLIPVYTPPPALSALPAGAIPLDAHFGDIAILKGYASSTDQAQPGDRVYLTLYWQPLRRTDRPYSTYLHLLDQDGILVTQRDTYPGLGRDATTAWTPGQLFADRYLVVIPDTAYAPVEAQWSTGLWQKETGERAFVVNANGEPIAADLNLGRLALRPRAGQGPNPVDLNFAGQIRLTGYEVSPRVLTPGQTLKLTVYWKNEQRRGDEELRVRVLAADGTPRAESRFAIQAVVQSVQLALAPDSAPGLYNLVISVISGDDEVFMVAADGHKLEQTLQLTGLRVAAP